MRMPRHKHDRDRGAVAVEAAIVAPLLVVLLLGIVEMSLLMRDSVSATSAVRTGARIASASADAGPGTCEASAPSPPPCTPASAPAVAQAAADAIAKAGSAMPKDAIDFVLVYDANTAGYPQPSTNRQLVCSTNCVKYVWDDGLNKFRYASGSWSSASINACINDPARQTVGVGMRAHHDFITGFFGDGVNLEERSVMSFEPLPNESCKPGTAYPHA